MKTLRAPVFRSVDAVIAHLEEMATTPSVEGDGLTELDHGLQCAALLERDYPSDAELQLAGLLHDVGHAWDGPGQPRHAAIGAKALRGLLGERVARLIAGHVAAKRYLVGVDPEYRKLLSPDSLMTLAAQGGEFTAAEVERFRAQRDWEAMLALRRADDLAKLPGATVPGIEHWVQLLKNSLSLPRRGQG